MAKQHGASDHDAHGHSGGHSHNMSGVFLVRDLLASAARRLMIHVST